MEERNAIDVCNKHSCESPIFKGDIVWKKGIDLYCHLNCLVEDLTKEKTRAENTSQK